MQCRPECGACCIAPSIHQAFLGMPLGKKAGERCVHLADDLSCLIFTSAERPDCCGAFKAEEAICGKSREQALQTLTWLEQNT